MLKQTILLSFGLLAIITTTAYGQDYARSGPYVGAGGLLALENFWRTGEETDVDNSPGFNARLGYRFHPNLGVEAAYEWYDGFVFSRRELFMNRTLTSTRELDGWSLTANAKVYPLTGRYQPYALLGGGVVRLGVSKDETEFVSRLGGGIDVYVNENWVINLEGAYMVPQGDLRSGHFLSLVLGINYRF